MSVGGLNFDEVEACLVRMLSGQLTDLRFRVMK
jgi:hypothetical protein